MSVEFDFVLIFKETYFILYGMLTSLASIVQLLGELHFLVRELRGLQLEEAGA